MRKLLALAIVLTMVTTSMGAEFRTPNFIVIAANQQICQQIGQYAEHYRKEKAIHWLGKDMANWPQPCPLRVHVTMDPPSGETEFHFSPFGGGVSSQQMTIRGPLDRLIHSVLPHEITHTVFAYHFKNPVPRWMDEGGSVLSEDDPERERHDRLARTILNQGQQFPVRTLFSMKEYPRDPSRVPVLYAEGFSICDYIVKRSNRQHLLSFVAHGQYHGWDQATKSHFGHNNVEEFEQAWLKHLRDTKKQPNQMLAATRPAPTGNGNANFVSAMSDKTTRTTLPPAQPLGGYPVARGVMPMQEGYGQSGVRLEVPVPITMEIPSAIRPR